jgi:hypothetical protein
MLLISYKDLNNYYKTFKCVKTYDSGWKTSMKRLDWKNFKKNIKNLDHQEIWPMETILDELSFIDAAWAFGAVPGQEPARRLFACFCARQALTVAATQKDLAQEVEILSALVDQAESFALGQLSSRQLKMAYKNLSEVINPPGSPVFHLEDGGSVYKSAVAFLNDNKINSLDLLYLRLGVLSVLKGSAKRAPLVAAQKSTSFIGRRANQAMSTDGSQLSKEMAAPWLKTVKAFRAEALALVTAAGRSLVEPFGLSFDARRMVDLTLKKAKDGWKELDFDLVHDLEDNVKECFQREVLIPELRLAFQGAGRYASLGEA